MGLQLSEGLNLTIHDIDKSTMLVHVRDGKGGKDRLISLPQRTLLVLRSYRKTHRHERLIFPGVNTKTNTPMDYTAVDTAFINRVQSHFTAKYYTDKTQSQTGLSVLSASHVMYWCH